MANQEEFALSVSPSIDSPHSISFEQKTMKKVNVLQPFSEIPSVMLWEILGRVPIKTCLACKLVCREWYHIILSPKFSSFRCHCFPSSFTILFEDSRFVNVMFRSYLVEFQKALDVNPSGNCNVSVDDIIMFEPKRDTSKACYVWSHCNEVVCFTIPKGKYWVCNFFTGQCVELHDMYDTSNPYNHLLHCTLGYCPVSGQYKVLIVIWDMVGDTRTVKMQTLGSGEWRSVPNPPLIYSMDERFLNGSGHWLDCNFIGSFHFGKEKFSQIPLPDDVNIGSYKNTCKKLSIFESCLCLSYFTRAVPVEIDIWIMKEYGVKESWVRQFVIKNRAFGEWSVPLMHRHKGKILVKSGNNLYSYDTQTHVYKRVEF